MAPWGAANASPGEGSETPTITREVLRMCLLQPATLGDQVAGYRLTHPERWKAPQGNSGFSLSFGWEPHERSPERRAEIEALFRRGGEAK